MSGRKTLWLGLGAAATIAAAFVLRATLASGERTGGTRAPGTPSVVRAEGLVTTPAAIRETARTVGTLAANESIDVVAEISRRLVAVHVAEGATVAAGDLLFELDDADLRASLAELEARRELSAKTVERQRVLIERDRKALSQQAFDQARADLRVAEAQIQAVRVTLSKTKIRAPFAGRIGIRRVSEGAWVTPETRLTTLQDTSRMKIDFTLPERYAPAIEPGRSFTFRLAGRPETFEGRVLAIEPRIDADTRSLLVRGQSANESGALIPGGFATVEVPLEAISGGVSVPAEALIPSAEGHGVYVFRDGKAELRAVEIGVRTASSVQILSGVEAGETVLTSNLLRIGPGTAVELALPAERAS